MGPSLHHWQGKLEISTDHRGKTAVTTALGTILQSQLNIIHIWSTLWLLRISHPKCSILNIGPHQQNNSFQIDQNKIKEVDHVCDLGVTIDSKLEFVCHCGIVGSAPARDGTGCKFDS